ncbi:tyrosine-type recombinase/integrase [Rickettsiella endosymbiont of Dermanyssus gallinae]|uniref:tyrosine-type recombinase/integrase n=1 Tax=Rickettsiella endosymbiont of Dermanyssus gallinae TaxID=2856608 RepID=UPI001C52E5B6|nr:site-specific integrase [Rickettsiella endosymbiont of Dermanyssus gallinae]
MANIEKRITQDGKISFRVKVRLKGFPTQTATFQRLTDARKWVQQTEASLREGRHFKTTEAKRHTLAEAIDRYIHKVLPTQSKKEKNQLTQLKYWKEILGTYTLAEITPSLLAEQRDRLLEEKTKRKELRTPATVNRYLAALSHVFTVAIKEWSWVEENPLLKITKPKEPRGRVRFLSDEERPRLLEACKASDSKILYTVVVLALSTGARRMELLGLSWKDIDLLRGVIILHETKNGDRRVLTLSGHALELMKQHEKTRDLNCVLVFPGKNLKNPIDIRSPWETALKRAGITNFRFHDLRHSTASYLAMNGASLSEISEVLGHKTLQMVKRYAHLSEAHTSKVVAKMNEKIFG